jgi:hypothetical protein
MGAVSESKLAEVKRRVHPGRNRDDTNHLYSSGPLSPLVVSLLLVRMEPFTSSHIHLQGNRFDVADRLFSSISATFQSLISEITEFWELPPEFFFCPEFLENSNKFDLGKTEDNVVGDVRLPIWAKTPLQFVYLHRKVLESDHVSEQLPHWIDLIWGVNQRSMDADNVYHPNLYAEVWESKTADRFEVEAFMRLVGQMPKKIFRNPHRIKHSHPGFPGDPTITLNLVDGLVFDAADFKATASKLTGYFVSNCDHVIVVTISANDTDHITKKKVVSKMIELKLYPIRLIVISNDIFHLFESTKTTEQRTVASTAISGEWFSVTSDDFITTIYSRYLVDPLWEFRSFRGPVTCTAISDTYKVHIIGTTDGALVITSLTTQESLRVINLGDILPTEITVTESWGFIVTYGAEIIDGVRYFCLVVHTINGAFVRKRTLAGPITPHCFFTSVRGFDYLAYIFEHHLFLSEVYFLDEQMIRTKFLSDKIQWLGYQKEMSRFVIVAQSQIVLIRFVPDDFVNVPST